MLLVVFSQFAANGGLTHTDLLSDGMLSLFLLIKRLNEISHRRPGFVPESVVDRLPLV